MIKMATSSCGGGYRHAADQIGVNESGSAGGGRGSRQRVAPSARALDGKVSEAVIMQVLGVGRTAIWRTRSAYLEGGVRHAVHDAARPGKPRRYRTEAEAEVAALACSAPPAGATRWTLVLLEQAAHARPGMRGISRETIRQLLKKTASNRGAG
jgi:hypothetical protein